MKAVLVVDFPTDCFMCPCFSDETWRCCATEIDEEVHNDRPKWCPLRPLPKYLGFKETEIETTDWHFGDNLDRADGWNACLDAITGEAE